MSKIRPILMNTEMARATLDNRKTQTRRLIPWKYVSLADTDRNDPSYFCVEDDAGNWWSGVEIAPYQVGDILYVRETWREWHSSDSECGCGGDYCTCSVKPSTPACYKADGHVIEDEDREMYGIKWTPSIHMPKWACRLFLRVTDVRMERLQQISANDARAEGCPDIPVPGANQADVDFMAIEWFADIWDTTTTKSGTRWEDNPWVWVYGYEICAKPEGWGE
ncbi:hypothetical protein [Maridesulfovibrio sp.]|uniref:hypothetical protein n=1 Tax=Maridesulfovibrio sp. TaxID=2795000 RepID=UPI0029C9E54E|nr:hypothetical protein [Maridesulfovibrio sp.]